MTKLFQKSHFLLSFVTLHILFSGLFAQLTFPANQVILGDGMTFYYQFFEDTQKVTMGLEISRDVNYMAVGFGPAADQNNMRNHDIVAFVFNPTDTDPSAVDIQDLYAARNGGPSTDAVANYVLLGSYVSGGIHQVLFERPYNTGEPVNDYVFGADQNGQEISLIWAWNNNGATLNYHRGNRGGVLAALDYTQPVVEEEQIIEEEQNTGGVVEEETTTPPVVEEETVIVPPVEETEPEPEPEPVEEEEQTPVTPPVVNIDVESTVPLTFPEVQIQVPEGDLIFYYEFIEERKTARMGLELNNNADYFAIGFAPETHRGMDRFDIAAFIFIPSASAKTGFAVLVQDLFADGPYHPPSDTSMGGKDDYKLIQYYVADGKRQVIFERAYDTGDTYDYTFTPEQNTTKTAISWAYNINMGPELTYHDLNRGSFVTQLYTGIPPKDDDLNTEPKPVVLDSPVELEFPTSYITIPEGGITLYFDFNQETKVITMGLDMKESVDYLAVGFADEGNSGMVGFDIAAFVFIPSGTSFNVRALDMYATSNDHPPTDESKGGTADYKLLQFHAASGRRQVLFERKFDTEDNFDYTFHPEQEKKKIAINWAWAINGRGSVTYHGRENRGTILSPMYNGLEGTGEKYSTGINADLFYKYHGYILLFIWGFLIDVAIWIARYRKSAKYYIGIHMALTWFIFIATVVLTAIALKLREDGGMVGTLYSAHLSLGIIILVFSTLQMLLGMVFRYKIVTPQSTTAIPLLYKAHLGLGVATYIIAKAQLVVGLQIFRPNYMGVLGGWYGALIICWIGHGYINKYWDQAARRNVKVLPVGRYSKLNEHQKLMEMLNSNAGASEILETLDSKNLKWAILDNQVFELKNFTHPGGNFIINQINGREVGRFIYGVAGLESFTGMSQHIHSKQALDIVRKNIIGTIINGHNVLVSTVNVKEEKEVPTSFKWSLLKKTNISEHTAKFEFTSDEFEVDPWDTDIRRLGRHMKISHISHPKTRLYTLVLSMTETRSYRRALLWKNSEKSAQVAENLMKIAHLKTLPLIIKKYEFPKMNTFSSFLHNSLENTPGFSIEGPFGTGFGLTPESTGVHTIFAAGTGVLPFLDLFDFLLISLLENDGDNSVFKNGFKIHIFVCFGQMNDFVGLDICEKLIQASREKGYKDSVKMTVRAKDAKGNPFYSVTDEVFDHDFVIKYFDSESKKIYICGPPGFNQKIPLALGLTGVSKEKIMLV